MNIFKCVIDHYVPNDPSNLEIERFGVLNGLLAQNNAEKIRIESSLQEKRSLIQTINNEKTIRAGFLKLRCEAAIKATSYLCNDYGRLMLINKIFGDSEFVSLSEISQIIRLLEQAVADEDNVLEDNLNNLSDIKDRFTQLQKRSNRKPLQELNNGITELTLLTLQYQGCIATEKTLLLERRDALKIKWCETASVAFEVAIRALLPITKSEYQEEIDAQTAVSNLGHRFLTCMQTPTREPASVVFNKLVGLSKKYPINAKLLEKVRSIIQAHEYNLNAIANEQLTPIALPVNQQPHAIHSIPSSTLLLHPEFWKMLGLSVIAIGVMMLLAKVSLCAAVPTILVGAAVFAKYQFFNQPPPSEDSGVVEGADRINLQNSCASYG